MQVMCGAEKQTDTHAGTRNRSPRTWGGCLILPHSTCTYKRALPHIYSKTIIRHTTDNIYRVHITHLFPSRILLRHRFYILPVPWYPRESSVHGLLTSEQMLPNMVSNLASSEALLLPFHLFQRSLPTTPLLIFILSFVLVKIYRLHQTRKLQIPGIPVVQPPRSFDYRQVLHDANAKVSNLGSVMP